MTEIEIELGETHIETVPMAFARADKDRILAHFPEKLSLTVPGFGASEFPLRAYVKTLFDQIEPPKVKISIAVSGDENDDIDDVAIEDAQAKLLGINAGNLHIGDTVVAYFFDVAINSGPSFTETCPCANDQEGQRQSRSFTVEWTIGVDIEPGIAGVFEVGSNELMVATPCLCPEVEAPAEDGDESAKKKLKKKRKRGK